MVIRLLVKFGMFVFMAASIAVVPVHGQDSDAPKPDDNTSDYAAQIAKYTKRKVAAQKYKLEYKFKKGDVIRWKHDHRIVNETKFGKEGVKTSTRAEPEYSWEVKNVDSRGSMRFEVTMDRIKVWEQNGVADQIQYDSDRDKKAPDSCVIYQERVGRPSATYSISRNGQIADSKSYFNPNQQIKLGGVGNNPVIAFPVKPIPVGHKWYVSDVLRAKDEYGVIQQLNTRVRYELVKVVDGNAHITFNTEVLTPLNDQTIRSQIVTHLTRGFAVFDVANGVLTDRETRWDEQVIGYRGPESYMHYKACRIESLMQPTNVARSQVTDSKVAPASYVSPERVPAKSNLLQPLKK